jgi:methylornithine synthase
MIDTGKILTKALGAEKLTGEEILHLLKIRNRDELDELFKTSRELRSRYFGDKVFIYGFLYISTYCRNNCRFCFYRSGNKESLRYRKQEEEIVNAAMRLTESGVHLIDLTLGEDPYYFQRGDRGFDRLIRLTEAVKAASGLPLMFSPGVVPWSVLQKLAGAGADWYACYQETHNSSLFKELRPGQSYEKRLNTKLLAHKAGLLIEEGVLSGVGESPNDMAESLKVMDSLHADQVRAMNFVPKKGTPMGDAAVEDPWREMVYTAVMRLTLPDRLIPASLDVAGLSGLADRMLAGANVVTSLVPPDRGLAGVAQSYLDIDENRRSIPGVLSVLQECGLRAASGDAYRFWINKRKEANRELSC